MNKQLLSGLVIICTLLSMISYGEPLTLRDGVRVGLLSQQTGQPIEIEFDGPHLMAPLSYFMGDTSAARTDDTAPLSLAKANRYLFEWRDERLHIADDLSLKGAEVDELNAAPSAPADASIARLYFEDGRHRAVKVKDTVFYPLAGTEMKINGRSYPGGFALGLSVDGHLIAVNLVERDTYLRGVVPGEMPPHWHLEALKAQAVAARTYSIRQMNRFDSSGFDICDTTRCQVYKGKTAWHASTDLAIEQTAGIIMTHDHLPISAFYHASNGGHTENAEDVFHAPLPYIKAKPDPYSAESTAYDWQVAFSDEQLEQLLRQAGYALGDIRDVVVREALPSGRVQSLAAIGSDHTATLTGDTIRKVFGYDKVKSQLFSVARRQPDLYLSGEHTETVFNRQQHYILTDAATARPITPAGQLYVAGLNRLQALDEGTADYYFVGKGWGHGLGMSQVGALAMAKDGWNYRDILQFYYDEISFESTLDKGGSAIENQ